MRIPPFLQPGDRIGILSTARKIRPSELRDALLALEKDYGFEAVLADDLYAVRNQFAGSDEQRGDTLQAMLDDSDLQAILCARGGYGTQRIVDRIDFSGLQDHPKWVIGFSDITCLLTAINKAGVAAIHGPMGLSWNGKTGNLASRDRLRDLLLGEWPKFSWDSSPHDRAGHVTAPVIGGNLSLLHCSLGTLTEPNWDGAILFIEDLDEYLYHIDRIMLHLKRSGILARLGGLIVGGMTDMNDNAESFGRTAEKIIFDAVEEYAYPLAFGFPAGHQPMNYPFVVGPEAQLLVREDQPSSLKYA